MLNMKRKINSRLSGENPFQNRKMPRLGVVDNDNEENDSDNNPEITSIRTVTERPSREEFGRCGKIHSIRLINFMCHSNLFIEFGPNINFLVGSNGSGKSAVLTALVVGLGGSARETERATSINSLIKNGETNASIEITLSNVGLCPFEEEIYGPRITVVRNIRQSASQYQLKDTRGNIISKKLSDLRNMLTRFNIHPENPVFVLNQDTARQFLKTLNPSTNFVLIMKATRLDISVNSLNACHERRRSINYDCDVLKEKIESMQNAFNEEQEKMKMIENRDFIKEQLNTSKIKLGWLAVKRCQDEITSLDRSIEIIETRKKELLEKLDTKDNFEEKLSQKLSQLAEERANVLNEEKIQDKKVKKIFGQLQECRGKLTDITLSIQNVERRIIEQERIFNDCQNQFENYNAEHSKVMQQKELNESKLKKLKAKVKENDLMIKTLRVDNQTLKSSYYERVQSQDNIKNNLQQLRRTLSTLEAEVDGLIRNKADKISLYGNSAIKVMRILEKQYSGPNRHKMPIGPIGQYITVPDPKYRDLVEYHLGQSLRAYIVNSEADHELMRTLLQSTYPAGYNPPIIRSTFTNRMYDVSKYKVRAPSNSIVLMDLIQCDNPVVMNYLIDSIHIETILIVESKTLAEFLTSETENVPPNLSRVLLPLHKIQYYPSPNYGVHPLRCAPAKYLQVNADDRIKQIQSEIEEMKKEQTTLQLEYNKQNEETQKCSETIKMKTKDIMDRTNENRGATEAIMDIENFEYQNLPEFDVLGTYLENSKKKLKELKIEEENLREKRKAIDELSAQLTEKDKCENERMRNILKQSVTIENNSKEVELQIRNLGNKFDEERGQLKKTMELNDKHLKQKLELESDLALVREAATKLGDCIETDETEEELHETIGRCKAQVKQFATLNCNAEQVKQKIASLNREIEIQTDNYTTVRNVIKKLRIAYHTRAQRFQRARHHMFTMVEFSMQHCLRLRNYNLKFVVNHKARTADIIIYPPSGNMTANTKTLSGGERSYGTISLLKGLWSSSDHPFYFLDEYDVFTDEVNRSYITQLLIQEGISFKDRQYCFLTPQDTKVTENPLIKIHKLEMPQVK